MDFQGSGAMEVEELPLFHFGESVSLMESLPLKCAAGCRRRVAGGGLQAAGCRADCEKPQLAARIHIAKGWERTLNHDSRFWSLPATREALTKWIQSALAEDAADADLTAPLMSGPRAMDGGGDLAGVGVITSKQTGVICGLEAARMTFEILDPNLKVIDSVDDGTLVQPGDSVFVVESKVVHLLAGERIALNICGHLSGVATATAVMVAKAGDVTIYDTRKTIPGIRLFQKYAVTVGGGKNHRMSLADFPMFKENHRRLLGHMHPEFSKDPLKEIAWIRQSLEEEGYRGPISIEIEDEESLRACLLQGIEIILVDNVPPGELKRWLEKARNDQIAVDTSRLEASGGIDLERLQEHVESGVGRISVGAITHSVGNFDLSMSIDPFDAEKRPKSD